jgi:hypothetical protein
VNDRAEREVPPEIRAAMRKLSPRTRGLVRAVAGVMAAHVRELHQHITALEARPYLNEQGVWEQNKAYGVGMVVTDHGSAWVCKAPTCQRPGNGNDDWRLLVKRGRDGKGAVRPIGRIE